VVDYNFDDNFRAAVKTSVGEVPWLHASDVRVIKDVLPANIDKTITDSKEAAVLVAVTDYHLSNDGGELYVIVNANLYPKSAALAALKPAGGSAESVSDIRNALYRNAFMFKAKAPGVSTDRAHNMEGWSANHGEAFRAALNLATTKLARMLAADLQGQQQAPITQSGDRIKPTTMAGETGQILANEADGMIIRHEDGTLVYVSRTELAQ
jgi:hypothetical protein